MSADTRTGPYAEPRQDPWAGLLDEDERILWQGQPNGSTGLKASSFFKIPFALFFTGFSVFWMVMAAQSGGVFWMFGLLFFGVGVSMLFWEVFGGAIKRNSSHYTLTTKRAFIATNLPIQGKRLKSYPINSETPLEFRDGIFPSVIFATEPRRGENGTYDIDIGFEGISDGRRVFALLRAIQRGDYQEPQT